MSNVKYLLPDKKFYKANLHTHSTISDGKATPQEVKQIYKSKGYQILAITDHNIIVNHSDMSEENFLMLTGVEIDLKHKNYRPRFDGFVYHFNLISKTPDNLWSPSKPPRKYPGGVAYEPYMQCEEMDMAYGIENANAMIAKANEKGFLVIYNHPTWSCNYYPDYAGLKGLWGMEIRNSECCELGINENNARVFKDLVLLGNKIYPTGSDDMHWPARSSGMSWTMVGADELSYPSVIEALEKGDLYMSCGPEIKSLTLDGNFLKISCSDACDIILESHGRFSRHVYAEGDNWLNYAEIDIEEFFRRADNENMFIYLTVIAPDGKYATTRPYYLSELIEK